MLRATAGFLMVLGGIGLLANGGFALFDWAERHSTKDEEFEQAWAATFEEGEIDHAEAFYRKLLPVWTVLFVIGALSSLIAILLD